MATIQALAASNITTDITFAAHRCAINRAYYAALGKARELLESEGASFTSTDNRH